MIKKSRWGEISQLICIKLKKTSNIKISSADYANWSLDKFIGLLISGFAHTLAINTIKTNVILVFLEYLKRVFGRGFQQRWTRPNFL